MRERKCVIGNELRRLMTFKPREPRHPGRVRALAPAMLIAAYLFLLPRAGLAQDDPANELTALRAEIQRELAKLKQRERQLNEEVRRLDRKNRLLDEQLQKLQAAGTVPTVPAAAGTPRQPSPEKSQPTAPSAVIAQAAAPATSEPPSDAAPAGGEAAPAEGQAAPIAGPSAEQQQARQVVETAPSLSNVGGVLTPKGQIVIDPSFEYDYWAQNQLGVNGFQIIPGITFGNIFVTRFEQNISTLAVTVRGGVTDRLELNAKVPFVWNSGSVSSLIPVGTSAQLLSVGTDGVGIGDIQFGASYQINSGQSGWPIFLGNILYKSATGTSPFDVPIITLNDPNGQFLSGTPKSLATGTGFNQVTPSVTVLLPTAPGVLFGNLQWAHNIGKTQNVQDRQGGPPIPVDLQPGEAPAVTFGIGFALNDRAALSLSYQQTHVFSASSNGQKIPGSSYSFGTFNFGLGYQISQSTRLNLSIGIGAGPNTPAAKVLLEVPYKFSL